jgi:hypothetical protein
MISYSWQIEKRDRPLVNEASEINGEGKRI